MNIAITGIGLTSGLGDGVQAHREKMAAGEHALRPLADLLGEDSPFAGANAAWIEKREIMRPVSGRRHRCSLFMLPSRQWLMRA